MELLSSVTFGKNPGALHTAQSTVRDSYLRSEKEKEREGGRRQRERKTIEGKRKGRRNGGVGGAGRKEKTKAKITSYNVTRIGIFLMG